MYYLMALFVSLFVSFAVTPCQGMDAASSVGAIAEFDKEALTERAVRGGYGYKTSNLQELEKFCQDFDAKNEGATIKISVPEFCGISSSAVLKNLFPASNGFDIAVRWQAVLEAQGHVTGEEIKEFSPAFMGARQDFERDLIAALNVIIEGDGFNLVELHSDLPALIDQAKAQGVRLMVRSTGKEDSDTIANAGGNESIANVQPEAQAILRAMRAVICSYFGEKSLSQRLVLKDPSLFNPEIFVPVLVQQMVGEQASAEYLVSSGVMFTRDPECGQTGGVTVIQAAYGHGEGVVNSLVPVDTFYAFTLPDGNVALYPVIRKKTERLAPSAAGKLEPQENDPQKAILPSLSSAVAKKLYEFGQALEQYYGYALDIEFVVKNNKIFIVQARPIVHKGHAQAPSYVKPESVGQKFSGTTIGVAGGYVRVVEASVTVIEEKKEIIFVPEIGQALTQYLEPSFNRYALKVVVVGAMAPATSHEATTFRSVGIPVLCIPAWEAAQAALSEGKKLLVDPQQGQIISIEKSVEHAELLQDGWVGYPVPRELSVLRSFFDLPAGMVVAAKMSTKGPVDWAVLLKVMKKGNREQVQKATDQYLYKLDSEIKKHDIPDKDLAMTCLAVRRTAAVLCQHIIQCAQYEVSNLSYMHRLFPIRLLEALTYQQGEKGIVLPRSVAVLIKTLRQEAAIVTPPAAGDGLIQAEAKDRFVQLSKLEHYICSEEVQSTWNSLIKLAAQDGKVMGNLANLVGELAKLDTLFIWLQTSAANDMASKQLTTQRVGELVGQWKEELASDADYLQALGRNVLKLKQINLPAFADSKQCVSAWERLQQVLTYFSSPEFTSFRSKGSHARMAAVQAMRSFVDVYDQALKGVNVQKNVPLFQEMLQSNYELLETWVGLLGDQEADLLYYVPDFSQRVRATSQNTKEAYLGMMKKCIDKPFTVDDFLPTVGVDLAVFVMGAGHDFKQDSDSNEQPASGADAFTIMHQSLLNYCGVLAFADAVNFKRPVLLQATEAVFISHDAKLVGFEMHGSDIVLYYNKILGSHSCQIKVHYTLKTKSINITLHFCGGVERERGRWGDGAALTLLFDESAVKGPDLHLALTKLSNHELVIDLNFSSEETIELVGRFFGALHDIANNQKLEAVYSKVFPTLPNDAVARQRIIKRLRQAGPLGSETVANLINNKLLSLENLQEYREVIAPAVEGIKSSDDSVRSNALKLFKALFEKGEGFNEAIAAATECMESSNNSVRSNALNLFSALVRKIQGFDEAIAAAVDGIKSSDDSVKSSALKLFNELFKKDQGFTQAIAAAEGGMESSHDYVRSNALKLFTALFKKGQGFAQAQGILYAKGINPTTADSLTRALNAAKRNPLPELPLVTPIDQQIDPQPTWFQNLFKALQDFIFPGLE